jgi:hypothetical protein
MIIGIASFALLLGVIVLASYSSLAGVLGIKAETLTTAGVALLAVAIGLLSGSLFPSRGRGPAGRWLFRWRVARAVAVTAIIMLLLISVIVYIHSPPQADRSNLLALSFVAIFAGSVGFAELTQRYRDDPVRLFAADPTIIYVCVNVAAAVAALALIKEFNVFDTSQPHHEVYEVLLASFGSIAFFRSSLFTARVGDQDVDVGPATLLKSLLETSDRMINRSQARDRADDAASIMQQVDFNKAKAALPAFCFTVVESITQNDQTSIGESINKLVATPDVTDDQRSIILGIYLMRVVGPMVLARAVTALGDTIIKSRPPAVQGQPPAPPAAPGQPPVPPGRPRPCP